MNSKQFTCIYRIPIYLYLVSRFGEEKLDYDTTGHEVEWTFMGFFTLLFLIESLSRIKNMRTRLQRSGSVCRRAACPSGIDPRLGVAWGFSTKKSFRLVVNKTRFYTSLTLKTICFFFTMDNLVDGIVRCGITSATRR